MPDNSHLWERFAKLGERIGDGDLTASEEKYFNKEYKALMHVLVPETKDAEKNRRKQKRLNTDIQIKKLLETEKRVCGGVLQQARSGSKIAYCSNCKLRYKAISNKNP